MILEYYIIAAVSFAIMYTYNYGWVITESVINMLNMFDIDYLEEDCNWTPASYLINTFILSSIAMPVFLFVILFTDKYKIIKDCSGYILIKNFKLKRNQ